MLGGRLQAQPGFGFWRDVQAIPARLTTEPELRGQ